MDTAYHHMETLLKKRHRGRPARRWRDELAERYHLAETAHDRQMWMQHAETFAQPQGTMAAQ